MCSGAMAALLFGEGMKGMVRAVVAAPGNSKFPTWRAVGASPEAAECWEQFKEGFGEGS